MGRVAAFLSRRRQLKTARRGFDFRFVSPLVTVGACTPLLFFVSDRAGTWGMAASAGVLFFYLLLLLLLRLQCTLLDYTLILLVLGNLEALALSLHGLTRDLAMALTVALGIAGWVVYGAVKGITQAELLHLRGRYRAAMIVVSWFVLTGPALVLLGAGMLLQRDDTFMRGMVGPQVTVYGTLALILGVLCCGLDLLLSCRVRRAARELLAESPAVKVTSA